MFLFTLISAALAAAPGIELSPPVPIAGSRWSAEVTAWSLPPQSTDYLVEEVERVDCPVRFAVQPDGSAEASAEACPEQMRAAALEAAAAWTFRPVEPDAEPSLCEVRFVVRYSAQLGAMTLFAELDPGAEHPFEEGRPGLKLVWPARPAKPLEVKLKGKLKKAGAAPGSCALRARVGTDGRVSETLVQACDETLRADAEARVRGARFEPGRVDGQVVEDVTDVVVRYR